MTFDPDSAKFFILAGGQSSRFGSDKAIAEVDGLPLILHVANVLFEFTDLVTVVGDGSRDYAEFGLATIHDPQPHLGPCAGIARALDQADSWAFIAPCDMTGLCSQHVESFRGAGLPAAAFFADRWQPLFAAYHASTRGAFNAAVESSEGAWRVLEKIHAAKIDPPHTWSRTESWNSDPTNVRR